MPDQKNTPTVRMLPIAQEMGDDLALPRLEVIEADRDADHVSIYVVEPDDPNPYDYPIGGISLEDDHQTALISIGSEMVSVDVSDREDAFRVARALAGI